MVLMCGSGVPTANLHFAKVFLMRLFLERFQTAMKNRGVKQAQLESDRMLAELGRNWGSRLY